MKTNPIFMRCPHCNALTRTRTSKAITPTLRESNHLCTNTECGFAFVSFTEVAWALMPSACPNPAIDVPLGKHAYRGRQQAAGAPADRPVAEPCTALT